MSWFKRDSVAQGQASSMTPAASREQSQVKKKAKKPKRNVRVVNESVAQLPEAVDSASILAMAPKFNVMLVLFLALASMGLLMVASASVGYGDALMGDAFYFVKRHSVYLLLAALVGWITFQIPMAYIERLSPWILLLALVLLVIVVIPGIGLKVNGSRRWLGAGPITFQVAEVAKVAMILFLSGYLVRRGDELRLHWSGFSKPLIVLAMMLALLLLQPDFGSAAVMSGTVLGMLFTAGIPIIRFLLTLSAGGAALAYLATSSSYRLERLTSFLDPWLDPYDTGYQLTQALIAFGRGQWFGVGFGESLQKLHYLPEAHTDFVVAIFAEEVGLVGILLLLVLVGWLVKLMLDTGRVALANYHYFAGYSCFGFAILWSGQTFINIGVACGLLPTKGLTFPLVSYGGSSLLISALMAGMILRCLKEQRDQSSAAIGDNLIARKVGQLADALTSTPVENPQESAS